MPSTNSEGSCDNDEPDKMDEKDSPPKNGEDPEILAIDEESKLSLMQKSGKYYFGIKDFQSPETDFLESTGKESVEDLDPKGIAREIAKRAGLDKEQENELSKMFEELIERVISKKPGSPTSEEPIMTSQLNPSMPTVKESIFNKIGRLGRDPHLLNAIITDLERTVKSDYSSKMSVLSAGLSAHTKNPINIFLKGETSSGKTYNVVEVMKYLPQGDVWFLGGMSRQALVYQHGAFVDQSGNKMDLSNRPRKSDFDTDQEYRDGLKQWEERVRNGHYIIDLTGKILVFLEAPSYDTFEMLMPILSHDKLEIDYQIVGMNEKDRLQTIYTVLRGWPATIFCTTSTRYLDELATRCFTVSPTATADKFLQANLVTGQKSAYPWEFEVEKEETRAIRFFIANFKECMKNISGTVLPYAEFISTTYLHEIGRDMRDLKNFFQFLDVIVGIHFMQRLQLHMNDKKYVVGTLQDFVTAREVFFLIFETTRSGISKHILDFYHQILSKSSEWDTESATSSYNTAFKPRKSSTTIRKYMTLLAEIQYLNVEDHPTDKRKKMFIPLVKEQKNIPFFEENVISSADLQKTVEKWLNRLGNTAVFSYRVIDEGSNE